MQRTKDKWNRLVCNNIYVNIYNLYYHFSPKKIYITFMGALNRYGTSNSSQQLLYGTWKSTKKQSHVFHSTKQGRVFWVDLLIKPLGYKTVYYRNTIFYWSACCKKYDFFFPKLHISSTGLAIGPKKTGVHWSYRYQGANSTIRNTWPNHFCNHPKPWNEGKVD